MSLIPALFWAKSDAQGMPHSLVGHLLDAGAVAELLWDDYLAPAVQARLDDCSQGRGRDLLVLVCAWHDLGKATPAFQSKAGGRRELLAGVEAAGLSLGAVTSQYRSWYHGPAGAQIVAAALTANGVSGGEWLLPLIEGHHGRFGEKVSQREMISTWAGAHGGVDWALHQQGLATVVAERLGIMLDGWTITTPDRGLQLALAGLVVMADWIASSDLFPGVGIIDQSVQQARERAARAWQALGLHGGWDPVTLMSPTGAGFQQRFSFPPRPLQQLVIDHLVAHPDTGLLVVEAPMGEGKTEASFVAAELLAAHHGCDGVCYAMPTQGTTDAMYARVERWLDVAAPGQPISLLHGKNVLNEAWRSTIRTVSLSGICEDEFGMDEFGMHDHTTGPSQWLLGRHRGLLSPFSVATIDQVLWAATNAKFVSLRHAGLAGRVLVIDEVHSYDVYMGTFLAELLRWCGRSRIPVVLMSATLAPALRDELVGAWREGAGLEASAVPDPSGYPSVVACTLDGAMHERSCAGFRDDLAVRVEVMSSLDVEDVTALAEAVLTETADGGTALVICNTVRRAQQVFEHVRAVRGHDECLLINGRLAASERAERTDRAITVLGDPAQRPDRFVVIATQIAEQSFDADADILFTDVCPVDLLLQRIGRLHRHQANNPHRPTHLAVPRCVVTGLRYRGDGQPEWYRWFADQAWNEPAVLADATKTPYRPGPLLATAAALADAPVTWHIPSQVPRLVTEAYSDDWTGPDAWRPRVEVARSITQAEQAARSAKATTFRLDANPRTRRNTLWGQTILGHGEDEATRAVVRDGDDTLEVALVRHSAGQLTTLHGTPLGTQGERALGDDRVARLVLGDQVRVPARGAALEIQPLPQWREDRLLGRTPVLVINTEGNSINDVAMHYDSALGVTQFPDR